MIKLSIIFTIIHLVNSHGEIYEPTPRKGTFTGQGCNVAWEKAYLTSFKCETVCGNKWLNQYGEIDSNDLTGPISKTYKSGQNIDIVFSSISHPGYIRVRLCKLSSQNETVTQKCLDENLLEIKPRESELIIDKYTVSKKPSIVNGVNTHEFINQTITAKLPDGLTCDNCVLQWEWITTGRCHYQNGTGAPSEYCNNQIYKNCADIKIVSNPSINIPYKPNPASNHIFKIQHPPVFTVTKWKMLRNQVGELIKNNNIDPLEFKGAGLRCFLDEKDLEQAVQGKNILWNHYMWNVYGKKCRENCMKPGMNCPSDCYCRWFAY